MTGRPAPGVSRPLIPPLPPLARDGVGGLAILAGLRRNGFSAFPSRCFDEPVVRLPIPGRSLVIVGSPDGARHVLQASAGHYRRLPAGRRVLQPIAGRGLLVSEGETWRRQRRAMAPAFTPRTVPVLTRHVRRVAETACHALEAAADAPVDLLAAMQRLSLDIAAAAMFSLETASFGDTLRDAVTGYMAGIGRPTPGDFLLPSWLPRPLTVRRKLFRRHWRRLIDGVIAEREQVNGGARNAGDERDLYDLLAAAHGDGEGDLLADEVATMIVAGHETTALVLFWSCLLLADAPEWQDAIAAEAAVLDGSDESGTLATLVHTRAVVQETLRIYPPAFITARLAATADRIGDVTVPAGAIVLIPFWMLHRNPRWWNEPAVFDPRRFIDGPEPDRFAFLPFGAGPHVCIGAQLALTEAVLVLARLLRRRRIERVDDRPVLPVGVLSTRPNRAPLFRLTRPAPLEPGSASPA